MTVIVIMLIFATLSISAYSYLQNRADRASCISNLQNLYTANNAYLVDHDYFWPQIPTDSPLNPVYAQAWVKLLTPYQLGPLNWICPTVQRSLGNPDYRDPTKSRVDYVAVPFSAEKYICFRWPTQPWFVENGAGHGDGPMLVMTNGQILSLQQATLIATGQVTQ